MASQALTETHRALVLSSIKADIDITVQKIPTPQATPGSVVVKVLFAMVAPYATQVYNGTRPYPMPLPFVIGSGAIARVVTAGPDATRLAPGHLVMVDSYIRGRDDVDVSFLGGLHQGFTDGSRKLMAGEWKNWTYAEYAKVPLENCVLLDEARLLGPPENSGLGYSIEHLTQIHRLLVPYGGLMDIQVQAGETIIIAPATGTFGGKAVEVALALGAQVIAAGRNTEALARLALLSKRVKTVQLTMEVETDVKALQKYGPIDAYQDWSPPGAATSTHIKSCIQALKVDGRVSLMGGIHADISINYATLMFRNIQIRGRFMYTKQAISSFMKLIHSGVLALDKAKGVESFPLERWSDAFKAAGENTAIGKQILITP